jgi:hypothetical protein
VAKVREDGAAVERERVEPCALHCDIIRDGFWGEHPELLRA